MPLQEVLLENFAPSKNFLRDRAFQLGWVIIGKRQFGGSISLSYPLFLADTFPNLLILQVTGFLFWEGV
jgi:hypothetical protein